jgi:hypothetical protein
MASPRCEPCAPGRRSAAEGQATCVECDAGSAQPLEGQSACNDCGVNEFAAGGAAKCSSCALGTFSAGKAANCTTCAKASDNAVCQLVVGRVDIARSKLGGALLTMASTARVGAKLSLQFLARSFFDEPVTNSSLVLAGLQVRVLDNSNTTSTDAPSTMMSNDTTTAAPADNSTSTATDTTPSTTAASTTSVEPSTTASATTTTTTSTTGDTGANYDDHAPSQARRQRSAVDGDGRPVERCRWRRHI